MFYDLASFGCRAAGVYRFLSRPCVKGGPAVSKTLFHLDAIINMPAAHYGAEEIAKPQLEII